MIPAIRVRGLEVAFGARKVMDGLDLDLMRGEVAASMRHSLIITSVKNCAVRSGGMPATRSNGFIPSRRPLASVAART